jgi:hypothetical protein
MRAFIMFFPGLLEQLKKIPISKLNFCDLKMTPLFSTLKLIYYLRPLLNRLRLHVVVGLDYTGNYLTTQLNLLEFQLLDPVLTIHC